MPNITKFTEGKTIVQGVDTFPVKAENTLNFATTNAGAADTVDVLTLPKGAVITAGVLSVKTAEGGAATVDLGDPGSPTRYTSNADANAVAVTVFGAVPFLNSAETILTLTADAALDAAVIEISCTYYIMESVANA